jgi:5-methylthioadenosine/S-adenosylhomocysteine deaminase
LRRLTRRTPDACLQRGLAARDAFKHAPLLAFALAPHAPYTVSDASWEKIVMYSRQLDIPIQTHLPKRDTRSTHRLQRPALRRWRDSTASARRGRPSSPIHAVHLDSADIALLATQRCHVVHCPSSNMKLASGIAPVTELLRQGINVALGTDGAASNNRLDIMGEMRLAGLLAEGRQRESRVGARRRRSCGWPR